MINAWSLLYDEIYGDDEMSPCKTDHNDDDIVITTVGSGNTASADNNYTYSVDTTNFADIQIDTSAFDSVGDYDLSGVDFTMPPYEEPICTTSWGFSTKLAQNRIT